MIFVSSQYNSCIIKQHKCGLIDVNCLTFSKNFATILYLLFVWTLWKSDKIFTSAGLCYSCAGTCHNEQHCNCQIGSCEADYCFIEKKPAEMPDVFRITKGCVTRPTTMRLGCDYNHFPNHVQCVCAGDFCNDSIMLRRNTAVYQRRNITCRECGDRNADCGRTCRGEWCHEKVTSGGSGCGFGPPSLPYFYRGPELLRHHEKVCVTLSRGNAVPHKYCICNSHMCNDVPQRQSFPFTFFGFKQSAPPAQQHKSRSIVNYQRSSNGEVSAPPLKFYECINCDLTTEQNWVTSNCKTNRCYGHFCIYATQRVYVGGISGASMGQNGGAKMTNGLPMAIIHEKQACMNVTDPRHVQLGCTHKWMNNDEEEVYCACRGDHCNIDLMTAAASGTSQPNNVGAKPDKVLQTKDPNNKFLKP